MAARRSDNWVALYVAAGGPTYLAFMLPTLGTFVAAHPGWRLPVAVAQLLGALMPVPFMLFFPDGRFVPRRGAALALLWAAAWAGLVLRWPGVPAATVGHDHLQGTLRFDDDA